MAWLRAFPLAFAVAALTACPALAEVAIGVAVPTRGPEALVGADIRRAARLAAERFNAEGGVSGERISIVEADDGCAAQPAQEAARTLIGRHVAVVIGHPCGSAAVAAAPLYAEAGVPFIAAATRHPALTDKRAGPAVFRLAGRDGHQGTIAGNFLAREFAGKPLAIVYGGSVYSKELAAEATAALKGAGRADVPTGTIASGQKEYGPLVGKLAAAHVEAVYFAGYPIEAGLLLRQLRAAGVQATFFGSDTIAGEQFAQAAGEAAERAGTLLPYDPLRSLSPETLRAAFPNAEPTAAFILAYAAMEAWRGAVQQAQSIAGDAVGKALQGSGFNTVLGRLTFDAKGDAELPAYDMVWWGDGAWRAQRP
jgi:branched-chain amino acid transport system substrate-binding protein